ncbi:MAG: hypothetical protein CMJ78_10165 [Planctomycetaceae bacterium]|nr:hypothetical protein [Planctomycetaceae bacterium]
MLEFVLINSVLATLLFAIALLASRLFRDPRVQHALWVLVLVKLLTPPLLTLQASLIAGATLLPTQDSLTWCVTIAVGATVWFAWTIRSVVRFYLDVVKNGSEDQRLEAATERAAASLGIEHPPSAISTEAHVSPLLWSAGCHCVVLVPRKLIERVEDTQLMLLVAHELAHYRRRDHWVRQLEFFAVGLFWWLPTTWWARRQIESAEERSCDQLVLQIFPEHPRCYADSLLKTLEFLSGEDPQPAVCSQFCRPDSWRRRFDAIFQEPPRRHRPVAFTALIIASVALLSIGPSLQSPKSSNLTMSFAGQTWELLPAPGLQQRDSLIARKVGNRELLSSPVTLVANASASERYVRLHSPDGRVEILAERRQRLDDDSFAIGNWSPKVDKILIRDSLNQDVSFDQAWDVAMSSGVDINSMNITAVAFSPNSQMLATGDSDGRLRLWDMDEGCQINVFEKHNDRIRSVAFSPDGTLLATGDQNGVVKLWNVASRQQRIIPSCVSLTSECDQRITCVRFSRDGSHLGIASGSPGNSGSVQLWDLSSMTLDNEFKTDVLAAVLDFHPNGTAFITATWDGTLTLWDASTGFACESKSIDQSAIAAAAFSPDACDLMKRYDSIANKL